MNKENIILIGMPGSGKSTCGVLAAKALLKNFFDTDLLFQGLEEKRLQDIIDDDGIEYFLSAEDIPLMIPYHPFARHKRNGCCNGRLGCLQRQINGAPQKKRKGYLSAP